MKKLKNSKSIKAELHGFHIVEPSPRSNFEVINLINLIVLFLLYYIHFEISVCQVIYSVVSFILSISMWFRDVMIKSAFQSTHTADMQQMHRAAFILVLIFEALFFFGLFLCFFYMSVSPFTLITYTWLSSLETTYLFDVSFWNTVTLCVIEMLKTIPSILFVFLFTQDFFFDNFNMLVGFAFFNRNKKEKMSLAKKYQKFWALALLICVIDTIWLWFLGFKGYWIWIFKWRIVINPPLHVWPHKVVKCVTTWRGGCTKKIDIEMMLETKRNMRAAWRAAKIAAENQVTTTLLWKQLMFLTLVILLVFFVLIVYSSVNKYVANSNFFYWIKFFTLPVLIIGLLMAGVAALEATHVIIAFKSITPGSPWLNYLSYTLPRLNHVNNVAKVSAAVLLFSLFLESVLYATTLLILFFANTNRFLKDLTILILLVLSVTVAVNTSPAVIPFTQSLYETIIMGPHHAYYDIFLNSPRFEMRDLFYGNCLIKLQGDVFRKQKRVFFFIISMVILILCSIAFIFDVIYKNDSSDVEICVCLFILAVTIAFSVVDNGIYVYAVLFYLYVAVWFISAEILDKTHQHIEDRSSSWWKF